MTPQRLHTYAVLAAGLLSLGFVAFVLVTIGRFVAAALGDLETAMQGPVQP